MPDNPAIIEPLRKLLELQAKEMELRLGSSQVSSRLQQLELEKLEREEEERQKKHEQFLRFREASVKSANIEMAKQLQIEAQCPHRKKDMTTAFGMQEMPPGENGVAKVMLNCVRCLGQFNGTKRELVEKYPQFFPALFPEEDKVGGFMRAGSED